MSILIGVRHLQAAARDAATSVVPHIIVEFAGPVERDKFRKRLLKELDELTQDGGPADLSGNTMMIAGHRFSMRIAS